MWLIEHEDSSQQIVYDDPTPFETETDGETEIINRYPDVVRFVELEQEFDFSKEKWDWDINGVVTKWTPEQARDMKWEDAKLYRELMQTQPLPISGVDPDKDIIADCDPTSQSIIFELTQGATLATITGAPFVLIFTDHTNEQFEINAEQTLAIGRAILTHKTLCHAASQAIRQTLDEAVLNGSTADEILAIDITVGYP